VITVTFNFFSTRLFSDPFTIMYTMYYQTSYTHLC